MALQRVPRLGHVLQILLANVHQFAITPQLEHDPAVLFFESHDKKHWRGNDYPSCSG